MMDAKTDEVIVKIEYEGKVYYLKDYYGTYKEMVSGVKEKLRLNPAVSIEISYQDQDDKTVVADDSDLLLVRKIVKTQQRSTVKFFVEVFQGRGGREERQPKVPTENGIQYVQLMQRMIRESFPKISKDVKYAFEKGVPCEECFESSQAKRQKACENCYGRGYRPMSKQMKIIDQLIDLKLRDHLMGMNKKMFRVLRKGSRVNHVIQTQISQSGASKDEEEEEGDDYEAEEEEDDDDNFENDEEPEEKNGILSFSSDIKQNKATREGRGSQKNQRVSKPVKVLPPIPQPVVKSDSSSLKPSAQGAALKSKDLGSVEAGANLQHNT